MPQLTVIIIGFEYSGRATKIENINVSITPMILPHLRTLDMKLNGHPPLSLISQFMDPCRQAGFDALLIEDMLLHPLVKLPFPVTDLLPEGLRLLVQRTKLRRL